jgi:hypothetical protein
MTVVIPVAGLGSRPEEGGKMLKGKNLKSEDFPFGLLEAMYP